MRNNKPPQLTTLGKVAQQLQVPIHRVQYILRSRAHINPVATAGRLRLFNQQTIELIKAEIETIDSKGATSHG
jgi:hypothetical protein